MTSRTNSHNTVAIQHHHIVVRPVPSNRIDILVGQNMSLARRTKRIPFAWLAEQTKVGPDALAAYEDGSARPAADDLLKIATCLGVPVSNFFAGL